MCYLIITIIIAALILGLIDMKDQLQEKDPKPYRYLIELICMIVIVTCVIMIEKDV